MGAGYTALAAIYDRWQTLHGPDFTAVILPRLLATLSRHVPPSRIYCDVACGTGTLVLEMAQRGWTSWGLDASPVMIDAARRKAAPANPQVTFEIQDMRSFTLPVQAGLITSMFDSVNHLLTLRELQAFFTHAARALQAGGILAFDTNTEHCYRTLWTERLLEAGEGFSLELNCAYLPSRRRARSSAVVSTLEGKDVRVAKEIVEERCYRRTEVLGALRKAGFVPLEVRDFAFSHAPEFGKLKTWWVARSAR
jgi:SAM-dependent methyltransferase